MSTLRPFALVDGGDAWARASHRGTFLDCEAGVVELAWLPPDRDTSPLPAPDPDAPPDHLPASAAPADPGDFGGCPAPRRGRAPAGETGEPAEVTTPGEQHRLPPAPGGLAFDAGCRLYRADRRQGQLTRVVWHPAGVAGAPVAVELFEPEPRPPAGDFAPEATALGPLRDPRGVAVDVDDRLFVAEYGAARIMVYDLWSRRLLRAVPTPPGTRPLDLAVHGRTVWAALEGAPALLQLTARGDPRIAALPPEALVAQRVAVSPGGRMAVLVAAGTGDALVVVDLDHPLAHPVARATDLEWESDEVLCVARWPREDFTRLRLTPEEPVPADRCAGSSETLRPLAGHAYGGGGIVRTPDGRIGFQAAGGFRSAAPVRVTYQRRGSVLAGRLDAGEYQARWGRIFIDACIPAGAALRVWCATADETPAEPALERVAPPNLRRLVIRRPDLSPPMPPQSLVDAAPEWRPVYRRDSGRELAWAHPEPGDAFVTYEAPVTAGPGRFLWVALELAGNTRVTPRVRSLRVEKRSHDLLRRLPRTFSREAADADFLRRFLAICDGLVDELEGRIARRQVLLDPCGTPEDMLPWLASFLGMTLDERWPVRARRELVANAAWLFRFRGTVPGLERFLRLYLGDAVVVLEQFRLRGQGGALLGGTGAARSTAVVGGGFRVGGRVGEPGAAPAGAAGGDPYRTHAHRFTVLVRGALSQEQCAVVGDILELHRPAHTVVEICALGEGMRVGRALHVGISSSVGRTGGFAPLRLGAAALGGTVVGRPEAGVVPGSGRVGHDTRVG